MRVVALVPIVGLLAGAALTACGSGPTRSDTSTAAANQHTRAPATVRVIKFELDGTLSSAAAFAPRVLTAVAGDLEAAYPAPPSDPEAAQPARQALRVLARAVSDQCYSTDVSSVDVTIPAISVLPAPPAATDIDATHHLSWGAAQTAWRTEAQAAHRVAGELAQRLRTLPLAHAGSAIWSCLAALAASGPQDATVHTLLASDTIDDRAPQLPRLNGGPVTLVFSCPVPTQAQCGQRSAGAQAALRRFGAGPVTIVRADAAAAAITAWVRGAS